MFKFFSFLFTICFLVIGICSPQAAAAIINPVDDAFIISTEPDTPHGADRILTWTAYMSGGRGRSLVKFSLSGLPDSSQLASATLNLYQYDAGGFVPHVSIYHVDNDTWTEETLTWNNAPAFNGQVIRNNIGFNAGWVSFDLLGSGIWDYDSDLNDGYVTFLVKSDESGDERHNFYSKEEDVQGDFAPYLQILTIPEPATLALLGCGILGLSRNRK